MSYVDENSPVNTTVTKLSMKSKGTHPDTSKWVEGHTPAKMENEEIENFFGDKESANKQYKKEGWRAPYL